MVMGRLREAVSDAAETLRRVFRSPAVHGGGTGLPAFGVRQAPPLEALGRGPAWALEPRTGEAPLALPALAGQASLAWRPALRGEEGWMHWAEEARVCAMPVFPPGAQARLEVPPLPRRPVARPLRAEAFLSRVRALRDPLRPPATRREEAAFAPPVVHADLPLALGLPVAVAGEDPQALPRAVAMRYSLQFVRQTGENIRNLELLGIYRIPRKGVRELRHDARSGRLLLTLGPEALRAQRGPFMLARRRDDRSLVSCFLEET